MKLGQEVWIHGYIDEMRKDIAIIKNEGGYFGAVYDEIQPKINMSVIEDIKAEIKEKYDSIPYRNTEYDDAWIDALEWVLESVIDKHISGKENE